MYPKAENAQESKVNNSVTNSLKSYEPCSWFKIKTNLSNFPLNHSLFYVLRSPKTIRVLIPLRKSVKNDVSRRNWYHSTGPSTGPGQQWQRCTDYDVFQHCYADCTNLSLLLQQIALIWGLVWYDEQQFVFLRGHSRHRRRARHLGLFRLRSLERRR